MRKRVYPDWVQAHKTRGTTIKRVGSNYYLYEHTLKRVPGKERPVPVDTYIGVITPDGVIKSGKKKLALTTPEVKEYGFSRAVWELCPQSWKDSLGDDWKDVLAIIIMRWSPNSYISKQYAAAGGEEPGRPFTAEMDFLTDLIYKEHGVTMEELHRLDSIYLVCIEEETVVSMITEEQRRLLDRIGVNLEDY